jgi:hypothetical protein
LNISNCFILPGAVFGAVAFAEVACSMLGSSVFNAVYASTVSIMTGFVFFVMSLFYLAGAIPIM